MTTSNVAPSSSRPIARTPHVAIIGAGFSGLGMAIMLKQRGIPFTIFEAAEEVGGTWRDNTYPGCACDIPSHLYSFSFDLNSDWTHTYGRQPEILAYLKDVCDRAGLRPHIRFRSAVASAHWDESAQAWHLKTESGDELTAEVLIAGTGPLSVPSIPKIAGIEDFAGPQFHSAHWQHDVDLTGKRVAVVGTGASAIQFVPEIADKVADLHLFQRTPPWVIPRADRPFTDKEKGRFRRHPKFHRLYRWLVYAAQELRAVGFISQPRLLQLVERQVRNHIEEVVVDPTSQAAAIPNYTIGCKRVLISNDYYPTLNRKNVELIDSPLDHITKTHAVSRDGRSREVDVILWGTGFGVRDFLSKVDVRGRDGSSLNEAWRTGVEAYYGMNVAGFPNMFLMLGPNSGLGHNSVVFMAEAQMHYIVRCIETMQRRRWSSVEVLSQAQRKFNQRVQDDMQDVVWQSGCNSWYLDENGKNDTIWPGYTFSYWLQTRSPKWDAYRRVSSDFGELVD